MNYIHSMIFTTPQAEEYLDEVCISSGAEITNYHLEFHLHQIWLVINFLNKFGGVVEKEIIKLPHNAINISMDFNLKTEKLYAATNIFTPDIRPAKRNHTVKIKTD